MPPRIGPTAREFCDAVVSSYSKVRVRFRDRERWREVWKDSYGPTRLWLSLPSQNLQLPEETPLSVLSETGESLHLVYAAREQLNLDAIFSIKEAWFPIIVAIESEIDHTRFREEIAKLLTVRCPLKVGMTGFNTTVTAEAQKLRAIEQTISDKFQEISDVIQEDPDSEYLFLVSVELNGEKEVSRWYSLDFRAGDGPQGRTFKLVEGSSQHQKGVA